MQNITVKKIPLDKLFAHPENPNKMKKATFEKLKQNIMQNKFYQPLIVRPHPEIENGFQIINGHHRAEALKELGEKYADSIVWQIDDIQTRVLLASLNRLGGKDSLSQKVELIKKLSEKMEPAQLAKILPDTKTVIEKLNEITKPIDIKKENPKLFLNTLIFFLNDKQFEIVSRAMDKTNSRTGTKAQQQGRAITEIAEEYLKAQI